MTATVSDRPPAAAPSDDVHTRARVTVILAREASQSLSAAPCSDLSDTIIVRDDVTPQECRRSQELLTMGST